MTYTTIHNNRKITFSEINCGQIFLLNNDPDFIYLKTDPIKDDSGCRYNVVNLVDGSFSYCEDYDTVTPPEYEFNLFINQKHLGRKTRLFLCAVLDVHRLNFSRAESLYTSKFLNFLLDFPREL